MKKLLFVSAILTVECFIWFIPLVLPSQFYWLTILWQILLSTLTFITILVIVLWKKYFHRKEVPDKEKAQFQYEKLQQCKDLRKIWDNLWKSLRHTHGSNPYTTPWLLLRGSKHSGKSLWLRHAGFKPITSHSTLSQYGLELWQNNNVIIIERTDHQNEHDEHKISQDIYHYLLKLLKHKRPRQPLVGVIEMLPANQLASNPPFKLKEQACRLQTALAELNREYRMQIPLWLLVSKADRLSGFSDFFHNISQQQQISPWGFSLNSSNPSDSFSTVFKHFHRQLFSMMFLVLQQAKSQNCRQASVRFTLQFALIGERLRFYSTALCQKAATHPPITLKGIWFCSNIQESPCINLLTCELAKLHGFQPIKESQQSQDGQRYFNHNFLNQVLFENIGDLKENPVAHKLWRLKTTAITVTLALVFFSGLTFCWHQIKRNNELIQYQQSVIHNYKASIKQLSSQNDYINAIAPLYSLKLLDNCYQKSSQWFYHFGLRDWQQANTIRTAYLSQLKHFLLTPLQKALHTQLNNPTTEQPALLYDNIRLYMALFEPDKGYASESEIWQLIVKEKELDKVEAGKLKLLLDDLWTQNIERSNPDLTLVDNVRQSLSTLQAQDIIYNNIRTQRSEWITINELFGPYFNDLFEATYKQESQNGIPRFYTVSGYKTLDLSSESPLLKQEIIRLNLIRQGKPSVTPVEMSKISRKVRRLYFQDYIQTWQNLLGRINLKSTYSLPEASEQLYDLCYGEQGSLFQLIRTVATETQLASSVGLKNTVTNNITKPTDQIEKKLNNKNHSSHALIPLDNAAIVNQAFATYAHFDQNQEQALKLILLSTLKTMQALNSTAPPHYDLYQQAVSLLAEKSRIIPDLWQFTETDNTIAGKFTTTIANRLWGHILHGAALYVQHLWLNSVYNFYSQHLSQRFPLTQNAKANSQPDDFIAFFKANGKFNNFIQTVLQPFISETAHGWQLISVGSQHLALSSLFLNQISNVHTLQKALFSGGEFLQIHYDMRCVDLSPKATELSIRDNNGRFTYRHGPRLWQGRQWPTDETEQLSVSVLQEQLLLSQREFTGSWGWLRFVFGCNQWQKGEVNELKCSHNGYPFDLEISLKQRLNPFNPKLYKRIKLPEKIIK